VEVRASSWYLYVVTIHGITIHYSHNNKLWRLQEIKVHYPQEIRIYEKAPGIEILYVLDERIGVRVY